MFDFIMKLYFGFYYTLIIRIKITGFGTPWENCKNKQKILKTYRTFREGYSESPREKRFFM